MKYSIVIKRSKKALYILIWETLEDVLHEKNKVWNDVFSVQTFILQRKENNTLELYWKGK